MTSSMDMAQERVSTPEPLLTRIAHCPRMIVAHNNLPFGSEDFGLQSFTCLVLLSSFEELFSVLHHLVMMTKLAGEECLPTLRTRRVTTTLSLATTS